MWSFLLVFALLCWGSHGSVTCKNDKNNEVDWYVLYKVPKMTSDFLSGSEYIYIDSSEKKQFNNINSPNGVLAHTLRPLFRPIRDMEETFGFISYSDQPPGCYAEQKKFGHSKGLVMVDRTSTGVWILHSTPQFPFRRDQNNFWPKSGNRNAQTFICVTFNYDQFAKIGTHLQRINAFPFEHYIPDNFYVELQNVVKWTEGLPPNNANVHVESLTSRSQQIFKSFAKRNFVNIKESRKPAAGTGRPAVSRHLTTASPESAPALQPEEVGDLYLSIARDIGSNVYVQMWGCQKNRSNSYCSNEFNVTNIEAVTVHRLGTWKPSVDHSKWCVAVDQNIHWTCIADMNRAISQYERYGGALCIQNQEVQQQFLIFAEHPQKCRKRPLPQCDPDSDGDDFQPLNIG